MRVFAALLAAGTTFAAPVALACDCLGQDLHQAMKSADVVFTARVVDVSDQHLGAAELKVDRVFKGKSSTAGTTVSMVGTGGNCTFRFLRGERYLVFARTTPAAKLQTSVCSRTAKTTEAQARRDIAELTGF